MSLQFVQSLPVTDTFINDTDDKCQLENDTIAIHYNLRQPDATPVLICLNYDAHAKFEVTQPICCRLVAFLLLTHCAML